MQPRIYQKESDKKQVVLNLNIDEDGEVLLSAVDEKGREIANLISFSDGKCYTCASAKRNLEDLGYDTTFAKWDLTGAMIVE